jgi:hypothetical protein
MVSSFHSENHETIPYGVTFMMHQHSKNEYDIVIIIIDLGLSAHAIADY